jgi:hypothetical protein
MGGHFEGIHVQTEHTAHDEEDSSNLPLRTTLPPAKNARRADHISAAHSALIVKQQVDAAQEVSRTPLRAASQHEITERKGLKGGVRRESSPVRVISVHTPLKNGASDREHSNSMPDMPSISQERPPTSCPVMHQSALSAFKSHAKQIAVQSKHASKDMHCARPASIEDNSLAPSASEGSEHWAQQIECATHIAECSSVRNMDNLGQGNLSSGERELSNGGEPCDGDNVGSMPLPSIEGGEPPALQVTSLHLPCVHVVGFCYIPQRSFHCAANIEV